MKKIGLIGCGAVAGYGHLPAIQAVKDLRLYAVLDPDSANLARVRDQYQVPHAYTDADAFFRSGIEAVTITSPAPCHCQNVLDAARYGLPVLCEKPLATDRPEGERMIAAMQQAGAALQTAFCYRFSPCALKIRELVRGGAIGQVRSLRLIYNWNCHGKYSLDAAGQPVIQQRRADRMLEGGPLVDCGTHQIDLAMFWLGSEVVRFEGHGAWVDEYAAPDHMWLNLDHANGAHTLVEVSYSYYHTAAPSRTEFVYDLIGTAGVIRYDREQHSFTIANGNGVQAMEFHHEKDFVGLYAEWAKTLHRQPSDLLASAEQGLRVTEIAREATEQAIAKRGQVQRDCQPVQIDGDFPGGNIVVEESRGDTIRLHQDLRDTEQDWFYWCFRVRGAAGKTLQFEFTRSRALSDRGPAISLDAGATWRWLGADSRHENTFAYSFPKDVPEVRLSYGMPYQESNWRRFVDLLAGNPYLSLHSLCTTPKQRPVEYALLGCPDAEPLHRVAITCRHHCCEMMASYALEGLIQWVAVDPDPAARWLREKVQFFIVPFIDLDGVEDGDQGKNRRPHDHGRDYEGTSIYAATAALRNRLPEWGAGRLNVALDLHCPWIAGPNNEAIYLVGAAAGRIEQEQRRFSQYVESARQGPLPFRQQDFLPFGSAWNIASNYAGKSLAAWLAEWPEIRLATAIEIPYATAHAVEVNPSSARLFGADLGRGFATYLRGQTPK